MASSSAMTADEFIGMQSTDSEDLDSTCLWPISAALPAAAARSDKARLDKAEGAAAVAEARLAERGGAVAAAEARSGETGGSAAKARPDKPRPVAASLPVVALESNEKWRKFGEVTLPAYLSEVLNPELHRHYMIVRARLMHKTVQVRVRPEMLKACCIGDPKSEKIYFALDIDWDKTGFIPPVIKPHVSLFYESQFADWAHFHAAMHAAAGLLAPRLVDVYLTPWGKSHFEVNANCSLHALCRQLKWTLSRHIIDGIDIPENEFSMPKVDFHITWL